MLYSIKFKDFKVFRDQEFIFREGTTAIVGPNGSGKTTLLEGIEFALFRRITRKEKTLKNMDDLIRHGRRKAKVELEFKAPVNRRDYRVVRTILLGKTTADLYQVGDVEPETSGVTKVDEHIVELLGLDRHAFSALTYVRQGEIDRLSRLAPKKRKIDLYRMMGLGLYDEASSDVQKKIRTLKKELKAIENSRARLEVVKDHLPTKSEVDKSIKTLDKVEKEIVGKIKLDALKLVLDKVMQSIKKIEEQLESPELLEKRMEIEEESRIAGVLRRVLDSIPGIAEDQIRPHIRREARNIFRSIFGDRYSDFIIDDDYEIALYDLQGNRVSLMAASGGEDVCVNFALRVAVNTALQKHSTTVPAPELIVLDEPGAGLDAQRRRWLPEAIAGLDSVKQVIVVTHMDELREATDHVISLIPQGKGRQPLVEVEE